VDLVHRLQVAVTWRMHWCFSQLCLLKLPAWWVWNTLFGMKTYIAVGRLVSYWVTFPLISSLSKCVGYCAEFLLFLNYFFTIIASHCCVRVSDTRCATTIFFHWGRGDCWPWGYTWFIFYFKIIL
jgi:hypothetical protein